MVEAVDSLTSHFKLAAYRQMIVHANSAATFVCEDSNFAGSQRNSLAWEPTGQVWAGLLLPIQSSLFGQL